MFERLSIFGRLWCLLMHDEPMWPIHGMYECRDCGRRYAAFAEAPIAHEAGVVNGAGRLAFERHGVA